MTHRHSSKPKPKADWPECEDCGRSTRDPVEHSGDLVCVDCYYEREGL